MAEQAGHWLALGEAHAGPFTAGSEDTALWSCLTSDAKKEVRVQTETTMIHTLTKMIMMISNVL